MLIPDSLAASELLEGARSIGAERLFELLSYFCSGFPRETPELKFRLGFFFRSVANGSQVLITHA